MKTIPFQFTTVSDIEDKRGVFKHKGLDMLKQWSDLELYSFVDFNRSVGRGQNYSLVVFNYEIVILKVAGSSKVERATGVY